MHLSEINIYPIKSMGRISVDSALVQDRGLAFDRRWMLVDKSNKFITQREVPAMALLRLEVADAGLRASMNGDSLELPLEPQGDTSGRVAIWKSTVKAAFYDGPTNSWFSERLGTECSLVRMPDDTKRTVNPMYAVRKFQDVVSFADGYPFMLIGEASLEELNERISKADGRVRAPLPMNRFRPNFVVSGSEPFAEDTWKKIRIGETIFHVVKPCERCVITTVEQSKGEFTGPEPLKTLNTFRNKNGKVLFGQNLIAEEAGGIAKVKDRVEVLELR